MNKPDSGGIKACLAKCLGDEEAFFKLDNELTELARAFSNKQFFYLFALCARWFAKKPLEKCDDFAVFDKFGATATWHTAQFARLYILIYLEASTEPGQFERALNQLFDTADVNELICLVQSLQFLSSKKLFVARAREAARSNIPNVFSAVAHHSDFAFQYFDKEGWNQLILKAAFLAVPIWNIPGLKERNNTELIAMLLNYVRERQAASRVLPWDLWACPGWLAESDENTRLLEAQFDRLDKQSKAAIYLSLKENGNPLTQPVVERMAKQLADEMELEHLGWPQLAEINN